MEKGRPNREDEEDYRPAACGGSTGRVYDHGAFRVADELTLKPGQAGDDSSGTSGGPTAGGDEASPGGSNLLRGFAQQGNIFQIGTSQKPDVTTDAKATATLQSPNSQTGAGDDVTNEDTDESDDT